MGEMEAPVHTTVQAHASERKPSPPMADQRVLTPCVILMKGKIDCKSSVPHSVNDMCMKCIVTLVHKYMETSLEMNIGVGN